MKSKYFSFSKSFTFHKNIVWYWNKFSIYYNYLRKIQNILKMKKVILIAIALFVCSVANGLCYQYAPRIISMILIGAVCIFLLYQHWKVTKDWEKPLDPWSSGIAWFKILTGVSLLAVVIAVFINFIYRDISMFMFDASDFLVACITWFLTSTIAAKIESRYTCDL